MPALRFIASSMLFKTVFRAHSAIATPKDVRIILSAFNTCSTLSRHAGIVSHGDSGKSVPSDILRIATFLIKVFHFNQVYAANVAKATNGLRIRRCDR